MKKDKQKTYTKSKYSRVTVLINEKMLEELKEIADKEMTNISTMTRQIFKDFILRYKREEKRE